LKALKQANHHAAEKQIEDSKQQQGNGCQEGPSGLYYSDAQPYTEEPDQAGGSGRIRDSVCGAEKEIQAEGNRITRDLLKAEAGRVSFKEDRRQLPDQEDRPQEEIEEIGPPDLDQSNGPKEEAAAAQQNKKPTEEDPEQLKAKFELAVGSAQRVEKEPAAQPEQQDEMIVGIG
jgi:hypothetical protein